MIKWFRDEEVVLNLNSFNQGNTYQGGGNTNTYQGRNNTSNSYQGGGGGGSVNYYNRENQQMNNNPSIYKKQNTLDSVAETVVGSFAIPAPQQFEPTSSISGEYSE